LIGGERTLLHLGYLHADVNLRLAA